MISRQTIDRILDTARIEEVVGDYVTLKKRGGNFLGLCPFHNEKTPSFTVTPSKGIYKCFGCGVAGNAVGFLMAHDQLSYPDALRQLAMRYQIEVEEDQRANDDPRFQAEKSERDRLWDLMGFAQQYYQRLLWDHPRGIAVGLSYFRERGLSDESIRHFGLGYGLEEADALARMALDSGYTQDELENAGLCSTHESRGLYDRFRGRVMFPIYHLNGKALGFGGRTLKTDRKEAKYINSPETPLYRKSETLFGLYQARKSMAQSGQAYLVEGYMDVISMHQAGITNVVASSGTALTQEQARLLKRFVGEVTLIYDGDAAGMKAALRGIDLLLENELNLRVVALPPDEDPDSLAKRMTGQELKDWLKSNSQDFMNFQQNLLLNEAGDDPILRTQALQVVSASIACVRDPLLQATYVQRLAQDSGLPAQAVQEAVTRHTHLKAKTRLEQRATPFNEEPPITERPSAPIPQPIQALNDIPQESEILRLLVQAGTLNGQDGRPMVEFLAETLHELRWDHAACGELFEECVRLWQTSRQLPDLKALVQHPSPAIVDLATSWLSQDLRVSPNWDIMHDIPVRDPSENLSREFEDAFHRLIHKKVLSLHRSKIEELRSGAEKSGDLLRQIHELKETEILLAKKLGMVITH
ncbi:MAG: DNA primase [Bacteroidota bacterium]